MDNKLAETSDKHAGISGHVGHGAEEEAGLVLRILRKHGWRLLLVFAGVLLPLWGFGALVDELREGEAFAFDAPILLAVHSIASPAFDHVFVFLSAIGYMWGVVPVDVTVILGLALRRHFREGLFAGIAIIGSLFLNIAAKHSFERARPALWQSVKPEIGTYSFPSGHAMGSMTIALVLVLLCWHSRSSMAWRWPTAIIATLFVLLVGLSRIYLGVHYPSDILAGWTAASVWVVGVYGLVFYGRLRPWQGGKLGGSC
ncbi:MAG: phosphatase PAP2 family protein [Lysobacteraceae bacterium]